MIIRDIVLRNSDICGRYKFKAKNSTRGEDGVFSLNPRDDGLYLLGVYIYDKGNGYGQQMIREAVEVAKGQKITLQVKKR